MAFGAIKNDHKTLASDERGFEPKIALDDGNVQSNYLLIEPVEPLLMPCLQPAPDRR